MSNPVLTKTSERLTQPQFFGDPLRAVLGGTFVKADGTQPLTADWTVGGKNISGVNILTIGDLVASTVDATTLAGALTGNVLGDLTGNVTGNADTATTAGDGLSSAVGTAPLTLNLAAKALTGSVAGFGAAAAGVVPASGGGAVNFLRADGTWAAPAGLASATATPPLNLSIALGALAGSVDIFGGTTPGVVPTSLGGTADYLRADGTWATPSGSIGGLTLNRVALAASATTLKDDARVAFDPVAEILTVQNGITTTTVTAKTIDVVNAGGTPLGYFKLNGSADSELYVGDRFATSWVVAKAGAQLLYAQQVSGAVAIEGFTSRNGAGNNNYGVKGSAAGLGPDLNLGGWFTGSSPVTPATACVGVRASAFGGTSNRAVEITSGQPVAAVNNHAVYSASPAQSYFEGNVGIGIAVAKSKLHVVGLPVYADNAAAILGGLTAGAFYRTGADPDPVCVVH